jgi:hypothetical protein
MAGIQNTRKGIRFFFLYKEWKRIGDFIKFLFITNNSMPFFKEEAFREFAKEFKNQKEPGGDWEFYVKTGDFSIYRRPALERNPNLFQYRSIGEWRNVKPETLANVYLDLNFRKKWDKNMASHAAFSFKEDKEETNGSHFEMKYPWPMSNRDYAYTIEKRVVKDEDGEYQVILGESLPPASFPGRKGVIRIDTYMQNICIAPSEDGEGCKVFMDYFDDPKVRKKTGI